MKLLAKYLCLYLTLLVASCNPAFAQANPPGAFAHHGTTSFLRAVGCGFPGLASFFNVTCAPVHLNEITDLATLESAYSSVVIGRDAGRILNNDPDSVYIGNQTAQFMLSQGYYETGGFASVGNGVHNVAIGAYAMGNASNAGCSADSGMGSFAVAIGAYSLYNLTCSGNGFDTTAIGDHSGANMTTGTGNTIVGGDTGGPSTGNFNTIMGYNASGFGWSSAHDNVVIGHLVASTTLATGGDNILIGVDASTDTAAGGTSNTVLIKGTGTAVLSATGTNGTPAITLGGGTTISGALTLSANNIITDTTTGMKIGTATSQKLGFFNATPVVQPTGAILTALANLGLVGTPTLASSALSDGANLALLNTAQSFTAGQAVTPTAAGTQSAAGTLTPNFASSNSVTFTFGAGNLTIANPSNVKAGQTYIIAATQDATGSRTITWGSQYKCGGAACGSSGITLSTAANAKDIITCFADTTTTINCAMAVKAAQ